MGTVSNRWRHLVSCESLDVITIPDSWLAHVAERERHFCEQIRKIDPLEAVKHLADYAHGAYELVRPFLATTPAPRVLEIGSGYGFGLCHMLKSGIDAMGVEPGNSTAFDGRYDEALELLRANGVQAPETRLLPFPGEHLPFEDNTFDLVLSITVMEHVQDIGECVREALRVVRPGGSVILEVPNFDSFYEGHYNIRWLPYVLRSKALAKWYVRTLFRRADWFIDELHFTRPDDFRALSKGLPECCLKRLYLYFLPPIERRLSNWYYILQDAAPHERASWRRRAWMAWAGPALSVLARLGCAPGFRVVYEKLPLIAG